MTIGDGLEKCLRKGKGEEVYLASHCFVLLLLQLGAGGDSEELFKGFAPYLTTIMADTSASLKGRKGCAEALGLGAFIAAAEVTVSDHSYPARGPRMGLMFRVYIHQLFN